MNKQIEQYVKSVEKDLNSKKTEFHELEHDLLIKISFYQHERLVHFLVTMMVSIITVLLLITSLFIENIIILVLLFIFILLLIPYYFYYYYLENRVQYMYKLYDNVKEKLKK